MKASIGEEAEEIRKEVKALLETTPPEMDASLVLGHLRRGSKKVSLGRPPLNPTYSGRVATKSASFRGYTAVEDEMMAADRELARLEESNAALLATLEQTRLIASKPLRGFHDGRRVFAFEAEEEVRASIILFEAAEIKERRRREKVEQRRLENSGLKEKVSGLERENMELVKKLSDKRRHHERRQAEAREQEKRRRKEEIRSLRHQAGSSVREADLLREKLKAWVEEKARTRAREALWRWRAQAAASVVRRERKKRLAAEKFMIMTKERGDAQDARGGGYASYDQNHARLRRFKANVAASSPEESSRNRRREFGGIRGGDGSYPEVKKIGRKSSRVAVDESRFYSSAESIDGKVSTRMPRMETASTVGIKKRVQTCERARRGLTEECLFYGLQPRGKAVTTGAAVERHSRNVHRLFVSPEAQTGGRRLVRKASSSDESTGIQDEGLNAATEGEGRSQRTRLLAARERRAARTLLLSKYWTTWRAFTVSSISAKMTRKNNLKTRLVEAEKRNLGGERLALVCKGVFTASDMRRKSRAWRLWQQLQAATLQKRQAARLLSGVLRSSRRNLLGRAMGVWKSVIIRRARLQKLSACIAHRQRVFILNRAWSRIVWAAGEREAARARKVGAARAMYSLLASSARASRMRAWLRWKQMVVVSVARQRARRAALGRCQRLRILRDKRAAWEALRTRAEKASFIVSGVARLEAALFKSRRVRLERGWQSLKQASHRRAVLMRSVTVLLRSRSQLLRRTLYHWRVVAVEARAKDARAEVGGSILKACLAGVRRRSMQPAWESWRDLVVEERKKEESVADQRARLTAFSSVMSRLATRSNRHRQTQAMIRWRLVVARSAFNSAQAKVERQHPRGALIAPRRLRKQDAWPHWRAAAMEGRRGGDELGVWPSRASVQFSRELGRAVQKRRQRILRRSFQHWHREVNAQIAHAVTIGQNATSREAGGRRLHAVLDRNLLRRKARAWARLVGTAVAASGRLEQEREAQRRRARHLTSAEFRASRRLLSKTWLAWKGVWAEGKHAEEVRGLRAERAVLALGTIMRKRNDEVRRLTLARWRGKAVKAREREQRISALVVCLMRSQAHAEREMVLRCFAQWRVVCVVKSRAMAEKERSSAEATVKGQAVVAVLRRIRLLRLSEGFRRLMHHGTLVVHETKKAQVLRDKISRGLCILRCVLSRRSTKCVMASFVRWRWYAVEIGQRSDRALLVSARTRAAIEVLGAMVSRREMSGVSLAWRRWRSGVVTAAVYDGERASADLRVSDAHRFAGVRLLVSSLGAAHRRMLSRTFGVWRQEAKNAADSSVRARKMHMNLARMFVRIEKRNQVASVQRAWRGWNAYVRTVNRFWQILRRARTARMADAMNRWRLACLHHQQTTAEERRGAAVAEMRGQVIMRLVEARSRRQLGHAFHLLIEHSAWTIYRSKQRDARRDRQSRAFHILGRAFARHRQRNKYTALSRWRAFAAECRRQHDKALLDAAGKRSGAQILVSLVSRRSSSNVARAWAVWRAAAAAAGAQEGERASADLRVVQANHVAGVRLLISAISSARRRTLARAWVVWGRKKRAAAEAELRSVDKHFHLARTLGRINRRVEMARMGRAWWVWRETVLIESQAEMQAMERNYNIAQTVTRVARRAEKRRLARAWSIWARLAARGWPRLSESLPSFPVGFLAAARSAHVLTPSLGIGDSASSTVTRADEASCDVIKENRVVTLREVLRKMEVRSLLRSWRTWRMVTEADTARQSKMILGARRLSELLQEKYNARAVQWCWRTWTEWSMAERRRLEHEEAAASWVREERKMKAAAGAEVLARVTWVWEMRVLQLRWIAWLDAVKSSSHERNEVIGTKVPEDHDECDLEDYSLEARRPTTSPVTVDILRQKLRGKASPVSPNLPRSPNDLMVIGSPSPNRRKVDVTNLDPPEDDVKNDLPTTSRALGEAIAGRSLSESQSMIAAVSDTDHGSLDLSTSQDSGITSESRSVKAARSRVLGSRSSPDSLEVLSDNSSPLGLRILESGEGNRGASGGADGSGETVVQSTDGTPERSHIGRFESSSSPSGGRSTHLLEVPTFADESVHSLSSIRGSPAGDRYGEDGEGRQAVLDSVMSTSLSDLPEEAPLIMWDEEMEEAYADDVETCVEGEASRAEAFVSTICAIIWRRALKHWGNVLREEAYRRRMEKAKKVISLRRNMKLRRVIVSAIRRESYAWHMSDLTLAMRKWREFVRKTVDDEWSSLEISRMSSGSPMTPSGPRSIASGLDESLSRDTGKVSEGNEEELGTRENRTSLSPRSPFSPTAVENFVMRRLWDPSES